MLLMNLEEILGILSVVAFTLAIGCLVSFTRLPRGLKRLVYAALALRLFGGWLRYAVLFEYYGGGGDAQGYYARGIAFAERFWNFDFSPFYDPSLWYRGQWWETSFVSFPSGLILALTGPSLLGEFLAFALLSFIGLIGFAVAFRRAHPEIPVVRYARWIWLFPSLWFWPSSIGKEAIILMGLGVAVAGFIGTRDRINWPLLVVGLFFVYAIRPEVAAVVILSFILAYWLSLGGRWTVGKAVQGALILGLGVGGISVALTQAGVDAVDPEGILSYMERESSSANTEGSVIGGAEVSLAGVPMAMVNILTRPFPWEAGNAMALISAMEILAVWVIIWFRRHAFVSALRQWRSSRLLRVAVPFILVYSVTLGMLVVNLGIIARQRIFLFPFIFLLLEAVPAPARVPRPRTSGLPAFNPARHGAQPNFARARRT